MRGLLELGLGAALFPDRDVGTVGSVDGSVAVFPARPVALDLRGSVGVAAPAVGYRAPIGWIGGAEGELRVALPWSTALTVQLAPFPAELGGVEVDPFVLAGAGAARTLDGFSIHDPYADPAFDATRAQVHPTLVVGGGVRVGSGAWGARLQGDSARWVEVVRATDLEIVDRISFSAALIWRPRVGR